MQSLVQMSLGQMSLVQKSLMQMSLVWTRLMKTALQTDTGATPAACGDEAMPVAAFGLP